MQLVEPAPICTQTWAMLLDPSAALSVIDHAAQLKLPRRICRPLDRRRPILINQDLAEFDAEIEAANDEEVFEADTSEA